MAGECLGHGPEHVGSRNDADEVAVRLDNRKTFLMPLAEQARHVRKGGRGCRGHRVRRHHRRHRAIRQALEVLLAVSLTHDVEQLDAGFESASLHEIAVAYEADEMPDVIDHRQSSESLPNQSLDRRASWCVGSYRLNVVCHHITDLQIETHFADRAFAVRGDADLVHCDHAAGGESLDTRQ